MSKAKLTSEQQKILDTDKKNILVSAAAGSGKTFTLIEKCKSLIVDKKVPIKNILFVTFTNAAASEMKERLFVALDAIEDKSPFLQEQISDLVVSNISTIDSFCTRLLRQYFYEVGLDPSFEILDEVESTTLKNKSFDKLVDFAFESNDNNFFKVMDVFSHKRKDMKLRESVFRLHTVLKNQVDGKEWFLSVTEKSHNPDLDSNAAVLYLLEEFVNGCKNYLSAAEGLLEKCKKASNQQLIDVLCPLIDNITLLASAKSYFDLHNKLELLAKLKNIPSKKDKPEQLHLYQEVGEFKKKYGEFIKSELSAFEFDDQEYASQKLTSNKRQVITLFEYVLKFDEFYSDYKKDRVALDFSDLSHYTLKLLQNKDVRQAIKSDIEYVFVDEYQDTNYVQEEILRLISSDNNRIMVGDIKQSIYRFREAEPQIFIDKYNDYKNHGGTKNIVVDLKENFRSHQNILGFTNTIFKRVMTKEFGGVDYYPDANLKKGGQQVPASAAPAVKVKLIVDDYTKPQELGERPEVYSVKDHVFEVDEDIQKQRAEGRLVVEEIKNIIGEHLYDSKTGEYSKIVGYSDIAILADKRSHMAGIIEELEVAGIPYTSDIKTEIFDDEYMSLIKNLLLLLDNSRLDIPLVSVMLSDIFSFSEEELATIKIEAQNCKYFYEAVERYLSESSEKTALQAKLNNMRSTLELFRFWANYLEVDQLIERIAKETGLERFMHSSGAGEKTLHKYNKLLSTLKGKVYNSSLAKFVEGITENKIPFSLVAVKESVTLSTIHGSKGLEYPVVFVVGAGKNLYRSDKSELQVSKRFGISVLYHDIDARTRSKTIVSNAYELEEKILSLEEKSRLLYVALTRAISKLIVIGTTKPKINDLIFDNPRYAKTYLDWIGFAVQEKEKNNLDTDEDFGLEKYSVTKVLESPALEEIGQKVLGSPDQSLVDTIKEKINFKYPYTDFTSRPTKTSVSELLKVDDDVNINYRFSIESNQSAIDKGVAYHSVLQYLDYGVDSREKLKEQINGLVSKNIITREQYNMLNIEQFWGMIKNPQFEGLIYGRELIREKEFIALIEDPEVDKSDQTILQGVVDLIVKGKDDIILIDFKTNRYKTTKDFVNKYSTQLDLYAKAIAESYSLPVTKKYIYSFELAKFIEM